MRTAMAPTGAVKLALGLAVMMMVACGMPMTPTDLARYENRPYPGRTKAQVYTATVTALRAMGFQIIASDAATGVVKTGGAPVSVVPGAEWDTSGCVSTIWASDA